jgi:universal stress protein E
MLGFQNILVGVNLSETAPDAPFDAVAMNAVRQALWLARASAGRLTFFTAVPSRKAAQTVWRLPPSAAIDHEWSPRSDETARQALTGLVSQARQQGVEAGAVLAAGSAWAQIVRQVLQDKHDLVIVGTHDAQGLRRLLLGSTARKLLHECPCPVWVAKPGTTVPRNILVASDLSPLSDAAVSLAICLGHLAGAQTHILNVVEYTLDRLWSPAQMDAETANYHGRVRAEAGEALHAQLGRSACHAAEPTVAVHVADGDGMPDHAITKFVRDHPIDLLVLGTVARHGLSGILLGNTAERLLPEVACSVLAVKPANFPCIMEAQES